MIGFFLRFCAIVCLALMVIYAIVDLTRSIGASSIAVTPVVDLWDAIAPQSHVDFGQWLAERVHPMAADPVLSTLLGWPTVAVLAGLAILFALLGRKRRRRSRLFD